MGIKSTIANIIVIIGFLLATIQVAQMLQNIPFYLWTVITLAVFVLFIFCYAYVAEHHGDEKEHDNK